MEYQVQVLIMVTEKSLFPRSRKRQVLPVSFQGDLMIMYLLIIRLTDLFLALTGCFVGGKKYQEGSGKRQDRSEVKLSFQTTVG